MFADGLSYCVVSLGSAKEAGKRLELWYQIGSTKIARSYFSHLRQHENDVDGAPGAFLSAREAIRRKGEIAAQLKAYARDHGYPLATRIDVGTSLHDLNELHREIYALGSNPALEEQANVFIRQFRRILNDEYSLRLRGPWSLPHLLPLNFAPKLDLEFRTEELELFGAPVPYGSWCLVYGDFPKSILDAFRDDDADALREGRTLRHQVGTGSCTALGWFAEQNFSNLYIRLREWSADNNLADIGLSIEDPAALLGLLPIAFWVPCQEHRDKTHDEIARTLLPYDQVLSYRFSDELDLRR